MSTTLKTQGAWWKGVLLAASVMACSGAEAQAQTQPVAGPDVVHEFVEPASGARVRLYRVAPGEARFDISDASILFSKRTTRSASVMTMVAGDERVRLELTPRSLVVEGVGPRVELTRGSKADGVAVQARLAASPAVKRAIALLDAVRLPSQSPVGHAIRATAALLQTAAGDSLGARLGPSVADIAARGLGVVRVQSGPGDCWRLYATEAISAWIEYEQCVDGEQWWDLLGKLACLAIYDLRAMGAFSWWLNCVGAGSWVG